MGSDDTRRYRATDSDAITQDKNTYGVYLHTPESAVVLFTMTTVRIEALALPFHDHGMQATCIYNNKQYKALMVAKDAVVCIEN